MRRRELRVFVSSTFVDMQVERDVLVKHVFPEIRALCAQRGITFVDIDLRWGITSEAAADDGVLPICLAEIERCRPFFIGLLGERYGWVPERIEEIALERFPWLHDWPGRSITELEIIHGALGDAAGEKLACFYFRRPQAGAQPDQRVVELQQRIRESGCVVREAYAGADQLADLVRADLVAYVDRFFPAHDAPSALEREAEAQASFADSRRVAYVAPNGAFERLDTHAARDGAPFVVAGPAGCGKSSLLANWADLYAAAHPSDIVLTHFAGSTPASSELGAVLGRLLRELKARVSIGRDVPGAAPELEAAFSTWLGLASAALQLGDEPRRGRVIVAIDGIDVLRNHAGILDLTWLPDLAPAGTSIVIACRPGAALDALERRGSEVLRVEPLAPNERERAAAAYLAVFAKALAPELLARLTAAPQSASPLFLRAVLQEMRVYGDHQTLGRHLDTYLAAHDAVELYDRILARYEADYATKRPELVRDALRLVWGARDGLGETELLALLGEPGAPLPRAIWSPLGLALDAALINRAGLLGFFHDALRDAVERRYLAGAEARRATHAELAAFFGSAGAGVTNRRRLRELPWQLAEAGAWESLAALLAAPAFLVEAWDDDAHDLLHFAELLERGGAVRVADLLAPIAADPRAYPVLVVAAASKLLARGFGTREATLLQDHLLVRLRAEGSLENVVAALNDRALTLADAGDLDGALAMHAEQIARATEGGYAEGRLMGLLNEARIFARRGEADPALRGLAEAEPLARAGSDPRTVPTILNLRGEILQRRGDRIGARREYEAAEREARRNGEVTTLIEALTALAAGAAVEHDLGAAMTLVAEAERLAALTGDRIYAAMIDITEGRIAYERGDLEAAERHYERARATSAAIGSRTTETSALANLCAIMLLRGRNSKGIEAGAALERIAHETGDPTLLVAALGHQGAGWLAVGANGRAFKLFTAQARVAREIDDYDGLRAALHNLRLAADGAGRPADARQALEEEIALCRGRGDDGACIELERELQGAV